MQGWEGHKSRPRGDIGPGEAIDRSFFLDANTVTHRYTPQRKRPRTHHLFVYFLAVITVTIPKGPHYHNNNFLRGFNLYN